MWTLVPPWSVELGQRVFAKGSCVKPFNFRKEVSKSLPAIIIVNIYINENFVLLCRRNTTYHLLIDSLCSHCYFALHYGQNPQRSDGYETSEPILSDLCLKCAIKCTCTFKFEWAEEWDLEWNCECLVVHVQPIDPSHCVTSQEEFPYNVQGGSCRREHCHHFTTFHKRTLLSKSSNPLGIIWGSE